eukprot:scaffold53662_cov40-Phaeocystis_antarctica.AAC.2
MAAAAGAPAAGAQAHQGVLATSTLTLTLARTPSNSNPDQGVLAVAGRARPARQPDPARHRRRAALCRAAVGHLRRALEKEGRRPRLRACGRGCGAARAA